MKTLAQMEAKIEWIIKRHLPEILKIEQESFPHPWQENDFLVTLKQRNTLGFVATIGCKIVGYMIYSLMDDHIEVVNLAVDVKYRHLGIATQLINKLKDKLAYGSLKRKKIVAYTFETNLGAQLFFRDSEFRCNEIDPDHYEDQEYPAYKFEYFYVNNN